jgi:hypothetical protein
VFIPRLRFASARLAAVDFHSGWQPFLFEPFLVNGYDARRCLTPIPAL